MLETIATPQITDPKEPQDFSKPITIRWNPMGEDVLGWWLCVGTVPSDIKKDRDGDWNLLSEDMGQRTEETIAVPNPSVTSGIRVQLLYIIIDKSLDPPKKAVVLEPIVIKSINGQTF